VVSRRNGLAVAMRNHNSLTVDGGKSNQTAVWKTVHFES
jgi:hypothetical protein